MATYALVSNGVVTLIETPYPSIYANASAAANAGWLPYTDNPPTFNSDTQYLVHGMPAISNTSVTANYSVVAYTASQLASNLANAKSNAYATLSVLRANAVATMTYMGQRVRADDKAINRASAQHYVMTQSTNQGLSGLLTNSPTVNATIQFQINPGVFVTANSSVLWNYVAAASVHNQANWVYKAQQAALVNACTTPSAVANTIANATGWTY